MRFDLIMEFQIKRIDVYTRKQLEEDYLGLCSKSR